MSAANEPEQTTSEGGPILEEIVSISEVSPETESVVCDEEVEIDGLSANPAPLTLTSETRLASGAIEDSNSLALPETGDVDQVDRTISGEETTSSDGNVDFGKNVILLHCKSSATGGQCSVYIVGTAHVSQESCNEVQAIIRLVKPQIVFLELCSSRRAMLLPQKLKVPTLNEMIQMYRTKGMNPFGIIYSWFLSRVAEKFETFPGSEFRVAYEEALSCGAKVALGDRPVQITLRRTWAAMSIWHKSKLLFGLIFHGMFMPSTEDLSKMVEEMKDSDMITAVILEMSKSFPSLMDTLVHERDMYMAATLRGVSQKLSTVVAVVGKGHLSGITKNWEKDIAVETLLTVPNKKPSWFSRPVLRWGTVALAAGGLAIVMGIYVHQKP